MACVGSKKPGSTGWVTGIGNDAGVAVLEGCWATSWHVLANGVGSLLPALLERSDAGGERIAVGVFFFFGSFVEPFDDPESASVRLRLVEAWGFPEEVRFGITLLKLLSKELLQVMLRRTQASQGFPPLHLTFLRRHVKHPSPN